MQSDRTPATSALEREQICSVLRYAKEVHQCINKRSFNIDARSSDCECLYLDSIDDSLEGIDIGGPEDDFILKVTAPVIPAFPEPAPILIDWLVGETQNEDWTPDDSLRERMHLPISRCTPRDLWKASERLGLPADLHGTYALVSFEDDLVRVDEFRTWSRNKKTTLPNELLRWVDTESRQPVEQRYLPVDELNSAERKAFEKRFVELSKASAAKRQKHSTDSQPLLLPGKTPEILFSDDPARQLALTKWLAERQEWLKQTHDANIVMDLYLKLYELRTRLSDSNLRDEIVLGNYILQTAATLEADIKYPLLCRTLVFELGANAKSIELKADLAAQSRVQNEVFTALPTKFSINFNAVQDVVKDPQINEAGLEFATTDHFQASFEALANRLAPKSAWSEDKNHLPFNQGMQVAIYPRPVLLYRKRLLGVGQAISNIIDAIHDQVIDPPAALKSLVCPSSLDESLSSKPLPDLNERIARAAGESQQILLTEAANEDQLRIAQMLSEGKNVIVLGPPGTGKTHTIANLMGDLLAKGKQVLVTSTKTQALTVLSDKLNKEIRPLCLSWLDQPVKNCENATAFADRIESIEPAYERQEIEKIRKRRYELRQKSAALRQAVFQSFLPESEEYLFCGEKLTLQQIAERLQKLEYAKDFVPGPVLTENNPEGAMPLSRDDLAQLSYSSTLWSNEERNLLEAGLPDLSLLPSPELIRTWHDKRTQIQHVLKDSNGIWCSEKLQLDGRKILVMESASIPRPFECLRDASAALAEAWNKLELSKFQDFLNDKLVRSALIAGLDGSSRGERFKNLSNELREAAKAEDEAHLKIADISFAPEALLDDAEFKEAFAWLGETHPDGKMSFLEKNISRRREHAVLSKLSVNGEPVFSTRTMEAVATKLSLKATIDQLASKWNLLAKHAGSPLFEELDASVFELSRRYAEPLYEASFWSAYCLKPFLSELDAAEVNLDDFLPRNANNKTEEEHLKCIHDFITTISPYMLQMAATAELSTIEDLIAEEEAVWQKFADYPLIKDICAGIRNNADKYEKAAAELKRIRTGDNLARFGAWRTLLQKLERVAPGWAQQFRDGTASDAHSYDEYAASFMYLALDHLFNEHSPKKAKVLSEQTEELSRQIRELTGKLAAKEAWTRAAEHAEANPADLKFLKIAAQNFRRYGKGTGKKAPLYMQLAVQNLEKGRTAVPAWIIPIQQAITSFRPGSLFDVVIVDEASQADITSVVLLALAKQIVVVGDNKQVTPIRVGLKDGMLDRIHKTLLAGQVPNADLYSYDQSLYDLADVAFSHVMLHEHFRCVPAIIGYCNDLSYDGRIEPLRPADSTKLLPPFVLHQVPGWKDGDTNEPEGDAIARLMKACFELPEYKEKTFGVVVMRTSGGGAQVTSITNKLQKAISSEQLLKHKVIVGTAPDFQGDERDVIFLSLVDVPQKNGFIRLESTENDLQKKRFNVAVSRARDQVWIIHSFDWKLQSQPGDLRHDLCAYAERSLNMESAEKQAKLNADPNSLHFEAPVAKALLERGYRLKQQFPVGKYRIDIVVVGKNRSIALECDGERWHSDPDAIENDMVRQTQLERCGWSFIRLRGSEYFRDPKAAIDRVCSELYAHDITPMANTREQPQTELRDRVLQLAGYADAANIANGAPAAESNDGAAITATSEEKELPQEKTAPEASHVLVPKLGPAASAKTYAEPSNLFSAIEENEDAENEPEETAPEDSSEEESDEHDINKDLIELLHAVQLNGWRILARNQKIYVYSKRRSLRPYVEDLNRRTDITLTSLGGGFFRLDDPLPSEFSQDVSARFQASIPRNWPSGIALPPDIVGAPQPIATSSRPPESEELTALRAEGLEWLKKECETCGWYFHTDKTGTYVCAGRSEFQSVHRVLNSKYRLFFYYVARTSPALGYVNGWKLNTTS